MWPFKKRRKETESKAGAQERSQARSAFTTDMRGAGYKKPLQVGFHQPSKVSMAMDSMPMLSAQRSLGGATSVPEVQARWFVEQTFIGYYMCAHIAKHWLVTKACQMPARDAVRNGWSVQCSHEEVVNMLNEFDKDRQISKVLHDLIVKGREMGGAAAMLLVSSTDPDYYEKPFNPDGIVKGSYKGIRVIDASWMTPDLSASNISDPARADFYVPEFWFIGNRRYHHSHFIRFTPYPVAEVALPTYNYWGVSVPERIYERVYCAERIANEAPQLAMTKRLINLGIAGYESADLDLIVKNLSEFAAIRDNYGINISSVDDRIEQHDTSLADLDGAIMTQYQLVASAANVPVTKLMGTQPKGFNATGEYEQASYREELESIQTNDLEPLLIRHYDAALRHLGLGTHDLQIAWLPLDSPTAKELAEVNAIKAQADFQLMQAGAIDGKDIRERLRQDWDSGYFGIDNTDDTELEDFFSELLDDEANR
jgi:phage-related protein (TIGR01555 family)